MSATLAPAHGTGPARWRPASIRSALAHADRRTQGGLASLVAFAGLAGFCAAGWSGLVADPPVLRTVAAVAVATAGAAALAATAWRPRRRAAAAAARMTVLAIMLAAGLLAMGVSARMLLPGGLAELEAGLGRGLAGVYTLDWPYAGPDPWVRLTILLAIPATLCAAAALAFWPGRPGRRPRVHGRLAGLAALVALYAAAVAQHDPGEPLARGVVLLALIAAWLFLPATTGRRSLVAVAMVAAVAAASLPLAARLPAGEPLVDYTTWSWVGAPASFAWNHSYGPMDWPRDGQTVLTVESQRPHYWKLMALDRFDGLRWERSQTAASQGSDPAAPVTGPARWEAEVEVTVEGLPGELLVTPGSVRAVEGAGTVTFTGDGAASVNEELETGTTYTVQAYAPNPTAERMRGTPDLDPLVVQSHTTLHLPPTEEDGVDGLGAPIVLPRFSDGAGGTPGARRAVLASPYADVYRLARRLASGAPTTYDAVKRIEAHLRQRYPYGEDPPEREYPLASFLLDDRVGYCQQFSGAMALMLRMNGIPARVATGFSPGTRDRGTDVFTVRDLDAHSWVEVLFGGLGWVPFDPTPPAAPAASRADETLASAARGNAGLVGLGLAGPLAAERSTARDTSGAGPGPGDAQPAASAGGGSGTATILLLALAMTVAALVAIGLRRRARGPDAAVGELRRALERLGHPVAGGTTLADVERRLRDGGRAVAAGHVARIRDHRFGAGADAPPDARGRRALRAALTAGSGPLGRARGYLALPPWVGTARPKVSPATVSTLEQGPPPESRRWFSCR